jgi:hypothetical protein
MSVFTNFQRMDILFGGRQNINPACVLVAGKRPSIEETSSFEEEEEDESSISLEDSFEEDMDDAEEDGDIGEAAVAADDNSLFDGDNNEDSGANSSMQIPMYRSLQKQLTQHQPLARFRLHL